MGWIVRFAPAEAPRLRLFCFPYAGSGASVYRLWNTLLPPDIEVCAVQPPGRENHFGTPPITSMPRLVDGVRAAIAPLLDRPFAFFGHSLGAVVAYETALALARDTGVEPHLLIVSGHRAPHLPPTRPRIRHLPDAEFLREIVLLNGMAPELLENRELVEFFLPVLRADFELAESYGAPLAADLRCPLLALGSRDDYVSEAAIEAWAAATTGPANTRIFDGDHFYLNTHRSALVAAVGAAVQQQLDVWTTGLSPRPI